MLGIFIGLDGLLFELLSVVPASWRLETRQQRATDRCYFVIGISLLRETHHHFNLDLDFRLIECLDANRRDAGHSVPEQFT